jgi:branched-chain amino acid transport system substrate-binding protein
MNTNRSRRARRWAGLTLVLAVVTAGACGGDDDTASSGSGAPTETTGGTRASGEPIRLGYVNTGEGPVGLPEVDVGVDAALRRVNEIDGGINGRPIELVRCSTDGTPESSVACANQFVEEGVVGVVEGIDIASDAKIPVLGEAGIPTFGSGSVGLAQQTNDQAFWFSPPLGDVAPTAIAAAADLGVERLGFIGVGDVPQAGEATDAAVASGEDYGVDVSVYTYSAAAPDFTPALAAAQADGVDAIFFSGTEDFCTNFVTTTRNQAFDGPLFMAVCTDYADALGQQAAGTYNLGYFYGPRSRRSAPEPSQEAIEEYVDDMEAVGHGDEATATIPLVFGYISVIEAAEVLRTVDGDITPATITEAFRAANGVGGSFGQPVTCEPPPHPGTSSCAESYLVFEFAADGTQEPLGGGYFPLPDA